MSHSIEIQVPENSGLPRWFDAAAPWLTSIVFHLGVGLLVLFLAWAIVKAGSNLQRDPIIIPTAIPIDQMEPAEGILHPNQNNLTPSRVSEIIKKEDWPQSDVHDPLVGNPEKIAGNIIWQPNDGPSSGGENLTTNGPILPYGTLGGHMGGGPTGFFGPRGGNASKVVYLIDHSGSLLDNFDFLRDELKNSVDKLNFSQQFAVVAFSEDAQVLGPSGLQHAGIDAKHDLASRIDALKAQGENDGQLLPFQRGFEKAFALKPELIYFLTDGAFDPKLFDVIHRLNPKHAVHINTLAFVHADPQYEKQLKQLAMENGGVYKFVSEKDLGK